MKIISIEKMNFESFHVLHTDNGLFRRINGVWEKFAGNGCIEQWGDNQELEEMFNIFQKENPIAPTDSEKIRDLDEKRLGELETLLALIPECPAHGNCIPFAKEWVERQRRIFEMVNPSHTLRTFQSPSLSKTQDILTVICDECDHIASELVKGVPLCPDCKKKSVSHV